MSASRVAREIGRLRGCAKPEAISAVYAGIDLALGLAIDLLRDPKQKGTPAQVIDDLKRDIEREGRLAVLNAQRK